MSSVSQKNCQFYAQQSREALEQFPDLANNLGYQELQKLAAAHCPDPVALEDARSDFYSEWSKYESAQQAEWCTASPALCSTEEFAATWALVGASIVQTMGNGCIAAGVMLLDGEFKELGKAAGEGIANSVRNIASHSYDAAVAYYTPELSPEEIAAPISTAALDAINIFSVYKAAGLAVGIAEAAAPAALNMAKNVGRNVASALPKMAPAMATPEGLSLSATLNGPAKVHLPHAPTGPIRVAVVAKKTPKTAPMPDVPTILRLRPEVLRDLLKATRKRLELEFSQHYKVFDEAGQIYDTMRPRLSHAEQAMLRQAEFFATEHPEIGQLGKACYRYLQKIEAARALERAPGSLR